MFFKDGPKGPAPADQPNSDPALRVLIPMDPKRTRMASPLILRPVAVATANGIRYASAAVVMNRALLEQHVACAGLPGNVNVQAINAANSTSPLPVLIPATLNASLAGYRSGAAFASASNAVEMFINSFTA